MSTVDILPHGATEDAFTGGSGAGPFVSTGIALSSPQYGAVALLLSVEGAGLGGFTGTATVQTRANAALFNSYSSTDWLDTDTTVSIDALTNYRLHVVSPVLDAVRVKVTKISGTLDLSFTPKWLADQPVTLLT